MSIADRITDGDVDYVTLKVDTAIALLLTIYPSQRGSPAHRELHQAQARLEQLRQGSQDDSEEQSG